MTIDGLINLLVSKAEKVREKTEILWRYPEQKLRRPLQAKARDTWPVYDPHKSRLRKNEKNWFYANVTFPGTRKGITLSGHRALLFISGWCPFTLWVDGIRLFEEKHTWMATGPIAEPFPLRIKPGKIHRLILCLEPTELPVKSETLLLLEFGYEPCIDISIELATAAMQLLVAKTLASEEEELQLVKSAVEFFDDSALRQNQWEKVRNAISAMEKNLETFSLRAKELTIHLLGHSHIDMDWMWTWPDTVRCIRRDFKAVTDLMEEYPKLTFTHSQIPTYQVVSAMDEDVFAKVKKRIAEGRWENAAATWIEGDLNMADGESIVRHMLYAACWTEKNLHSKAKVLWEPDTFGHPGNMPQIAKLGELEAYFHMRCNPGLDHEWPIRTWEGVDGTSITAFSLLYNSTLEPLEVLTSLQGGLRFSLKQMLHVWGIGDHGGSLSRHQLNILSKYRHKPLVPTFRFSTMGQLLAALRQDNAVLPHNKGETFHLFEGCFTTHARLKQQNRQCEGALLTAEALTALCGLDRRDSLRKAWTLTLFNHFHDIFDGAAVHDAYDGLDAGTEECAYARTKKSLHMAHEVTKEAVKVLANPRENGNALMVLNPLGFERTEPVYFELPGKTPQGLVDQEGNAFPIQKIDDRYVFIASRIPAFSSKTYTIMIQSPEEKQFPTLKVDQPEGYYVVETDHAVARIGKDSGALCSYYDKSLHRELIAYGVPKPHSHVATSRVDLAMNVFQLIDESPHRMTAWMIHDILKEENLLRGARVTLLESGCVFARLRIAHRVRKSKIEEDIVVYKSFPRIDFSALIDWRELGDEKVGVPQLKVSFAATMSSVRARYEGPFYIRERPADGMEYATQKWADLTGEECGFTLLNDSSYGCDALGSRLRITLLRNSYQPDPDSDTGVHKIRFAFQSHGCRMTNAELIRSGMAFNRSLIPVVTDSPAKTEQARLSLDGGDSVVCTALRFAEKSDRLLLRFFETEGSPCTIRFRVGSGIISAQEVSFHENPTGAEVSISEGYASVYFHPFEIKSLLVECEGIP